MVLHYLAQHYGLPNLKHWLSFPPPLLHTLSLSLKFAVRMRRNINSLNLTHITYKYTPFLPSNKTDGAGVLVWAYFVASFLPLC